MNYFAKKSFTALWLVVIGMVVLSTTACTKTEDLVPLPKNKMLTYKIGNLPNTQENDIYGVINNEANTITVYVPFYLSMEVIDPEIILDEGAKLAEEVLPVPLSDTTQTYTVNGVDGSKRTYRLIVKIQGTHTLTIATSWAANAIYYPNQLVEITGSFLNTSKQTLAIELTNQKTGAKTKINNDYATLVQDLNTYLLSFPIPATADSGLYQVKLSYLDHQVNMPAMNIKLRAPSAALGYRSVQQGGTLDITPNEGYVFLNMKSAKVFVNNTWYPLTLSNLSYLGARLGFPADMPVGTYWGAPIVFTYDGWQGEVTENFGYLKIDPKE